MYYQFAAYTLDAAHYELRRAGQLVRLEPRVFDLLAYLVQHPARLVTKEELLAQLWPNQFVAEDSLTNAVAQARKALGDTGQMQHSIQTVRRRGYRFLPPVTVLQQPEPLTPPGAEMVGPGGRQGHDPAAAQAPGALSLPGAVPDRLSAPAMPPVLGCTEPGMAEAERRQLTILFCDLVDSTQLASHRDPEDWREVVCAYQQTCAEVIQRFDGSIVQWLGDGLLVYFGWPQAHEDDALRAVRTGLGLLEALGPLNTRLAHTHGLRLTVRVGIHTGLVVVGEMGGGGRQERLALGDTPHIAARLQGLATPDTVIISAATFRLVEGYVTVEDLGHQALKGVATPQQVYRVVGESAAQSRLEVAAVTGLTPLIGRETDVALLRDRWAQSQDGQGQVVLLSGEAGIGKSRLVEELTAHVRGEGARRMLFRCSPYHTQSAFFPVIAYLQRRLHWHPDEAPAARVTALEHMLRPYGFALPDVVPLFAALLSVPLPEHYPPLMLSPQRQQQKTLEALVAWLLAEAERQPVLVVWEELHWADPSSLDFLSVFIDQTPTAPLLTLLVCRPEFAPPWPARSHVTRLTLPRFTRPQIEEMVLHRTGGKRLPAEVVQQIVAKTDGVPLFVEELTKAIVESGLLKATAERYELMGPLPALAIPATLQDALMARLDRLGTAKGLAQLGAVIGRQFAYELLREVVQGDDATVQRELGQLVEAELLYQRGRPPQALYRFKHALIQDAAYQSLLKRTRQQVHQRIAQVLEAQFPDTAQQQPELVAHHYTEAGLSAHAVRYWQKAGQRAVERSTYLEAVAHLMKGLEALATLPDTPERTQQELGLQMTLGPALMASKGQGAPEIGQAYARARELCRHMGETPELFQVLFGLWRFYFAQTKHQTARELAEQCLSLAHRLHDPAYLLQAHFALGGSFWFLGELAPAHAHLEQGIALYDMQAHRALAFRAGVDLGVWCLSYAATVLWAQGYPDQSLRRAYEALTLARALSHPYSLEAALNHVIIIHYYRREEHATREQADVALACASEQGFPHYVMMALLYRSWALAIQGQREEDITQLQQVLAALRTMGTKLALPAMLSLLAETYGKSGQVELGLQTLAEALALVDQTQERFYEAELYRLQGELLLARSAEYHAEAETCFRQALDIARHQQAKSWELRSAMSLSRLWQQQGKREEARQLLAPLYGWFTEGLDTADLQETKAFLEEAICAQPPHV